jgi:hypothetical protein
MRSTDVNRSEDELGLLQFTVAYRLALPLAYRLLKINGQFGVDPWYVTISIHACYRRPRGDASTIISMTFRPWTDREA